jgi:hypothetical protein
MNLISRNKLNKLYGNKYELYYVFNNDHKNFINFMKYCYYSFLLENKRPSYDVFIKMIIKYFKNRPSDYKFINIMRNMIDKYTYEEVKNKEHSYYKEHIMGKAKTMKSFLDGIKINKILDIGTESAEFLNQLEKLLHARCVRGLNIETGFIHYDELTFNKLTDDPRFRLYDGENIPKDIKGLDLVTILAVVHHMTYKNIEKIIKQLSKLTKYIYIVDHDLTTESSRILYRLQHDFWWDVLFPGGEKTYINEEITLDRITNIMKKYEFELVKYNIHNSYHRRVIALYKNIN